MSSTPKSFSSLSSITGSIVSSNSQKKEFHRAELVKFYVFNTDVKTREDTEHLKILFYHPQTTPIPVQTKDIGLSEALINFTKSFSKDQPIQEIRQQRHTLVYWEAEKNTWFVMSVRNPCVVRSARSGDAQPSIEWRTHILDRQVLDTIVRQAYREFRLFNGCFLSVLNNFSLDTLKRKMYDFFPNYIDQCLSVGCGFQHFVEGLDGVQFLPLDRNIYLRIQCFINLTESSFPQIHYSMFLYRDYLVWSGIDCQDDMRSLYTYLVREQPKWSTNQRKSHRFPGKFITGGENDIPQVYLSPANDNQPPIPALLQQFHLIIYYQNNITCVYLLPVSNTQQVVHDSQFFRSLSEFVSPQIEFVSKNLRQVERAKILAAKNTKRPTIALEDQYQFIYINKMNLAVKSTIDKFTRSLDFTTIANLNQIKKDLEEKGAEEIILQTAANQWIIGKKSDQRELYILINYQPNTVSLDAPPPLPSSPDAIGESSSSGGGGSSSSSSASSSTPSNAVPHLSTLVQINAYVQKLYGSVFNSIFIQ